jgi:hypothetical protein
MVGMMASLCPPLFQSWYGQANSQHKTLACMQTLDCSCRCRDRRQLTPVCHSASRRGQAHNSHCWLQHASINAGPDRGGHKRQAAASVSQGYKHHWLQPHAASTTSDCRRGQPTAPAPGTGASGSTNCMSIPCAAAHSHQAGKGAGVWAPTHALLQALARAVRGPRRPPTLAQPHAAGTPSGFGAASPGGAAAPGAAGGGGSPRAAAHSQQNHCSGAGASGARPTHA